MQMAENLQEPQPCGGIRSGKEYNCRLKTISYGTYASAKHVGRPSDAKKPEERCDMQHPDRK